MGSVERCNWQQAPFFGPFPPSLHRWGRILVAVGWLGAHCLLRISSRVCDGSPHPLIRAAKYVFNVIRLEAIDQQHFLLCAASGMSHVFIFIWMCASSKSVDKLSSPNSIKCGSVFLWCYSLIHSIAANVLQGGFLYVICTCCCFVWKNYGYKVKYEFLKRNKVFEPHF